MILLHQYAVVVPKDKIVNSVKINGTYDTDICRWESEYSLQEIMEKIYDSHGGRDVLGTGQYVEITSEDLVFIQSNVKARDKTNMKKALETIKFFLNEKYRVFYTSTW